MGFRKELSRFDAMMVVVGAIAAGVVPGVFFSAPQHLRMAVGGKRDVLEGGLDALGHALRDRRAR